MIRAIAISPEQEGELIRMLAAAGLPTEDVEEDGRTFFRIEDEAGLIGYGGWKGEGRDRLLRSLVVTPDRRGQGLGDATLGLIEARAQASGAERLHLLTTSAAPFFRARGYGDADRSAAPAGIRASREFASICPASAAYLVKVLGGLS